MCVAMCEIYQIIHVYSFQLFISYIEGLGLLINKLLSIEK